MWGWDLPILPTEGRMHALLWQEGWQKSAFKAWSLHHKRPLSMSPHWAPMPLEPSQETTPMLSLQWCSTCPCSLWHLRDFSSEWFSLDFSHKFVEYKSSTYINWDFKYLVEQQNSKGTVYDSVYCCTLSFIRNQDLYTFILRYTFPSPSFFSIR